MISRTNAAYSPAPMTQVGDIGGSGGQGDQGDQGDQGEWGAGAPHAERQSPTEMEEAW